MLSTGLARICFIMRSSAAGADASKEAKKHGRALWTRSHRLGGPRLERFETGVFAGRLPPLGRWQMRDGARLRASASCFCDLLLCFAMLCFACLRADLPACFAGSRDKLTLARLIPPNLLPSHTHPSDPSHPSSFRHRLPSFASCGRASEQACPTVPAVGLFFLNCTVRVRGTKSKRSAAAQMKRTSCRRPGVRLGGGWGWKGWGG